MANIKADRISDWRRKQAISMREEKHMTYQQIANTMGVSRAYIGQLLGSYNKSHFRIIQDGDIPYPRLVQWMNENQESIMMLNVEMGYASNGQNASRLKKRLVDGTLRKNDIDKLIEITGMDYEDLFWRQ